MSNTDNREWILEIDNVETRAHDVKTIAEHLGRAKSKSFGHASVLLDRGPVEGWKRFLGTKRDIVSYFTVEWADEYASLIFRDEDWSEYRAIDHEHPVEAPEKDRHRIAHGELTPHPPAECMGKSRAFAAVLEFINSGETYFPQVTGSISCGECDRFL